MRATGYLSRFTAGLAPVKTAFVRGLASVIAPGTSVTSPTYAIVNEYGGPKVTLVHFDFYRIESEDDLYSCGYDDYFRPGIVIAAEWCERIPYALPSRRFEVKTNRDGRLSERNYSHGTRRPPPVLNIHRYMVILAIDTTELTAAAAITRGELPLARRRLTGTRTHSETMLPLILELFEETGLTPDDIELFACSAGPGSFTGVRIGVSLIKGLAFGRTDNSGAPIPCSGVSDLHALALNLRELTADTSDSIVACPVVDARRKRFYNAIFRGVGGRRNPSLSRPRDIRKSTRSRACAALLGPPGTALRWGTALAAEAFAHLSNVSPAPDELLLECGVSVAVCAYRDF